jgi:hypothetical protein
LANPGDYAEMLINPDDNRDNLPEEYFGVLASMSAAKRCGSSAASGRARSTARCGRWRTVIRESGRIPGIDSRALSRAEAGHAADRGRGRSPLAPRATTVATTSASWLRELASTARLRARGRHVPAVARRMGQAVGRDVPPHKADRILGERNFGGAMVEFVIKTADKLVPYKEVVASRGKVVRAEPIAALYEQGKVSHVGHLPDLEDQMCNFTAGGYVGEGSPDRADALVWALTELMLTGSNYNWDAF